MPIPFIRQNPNGKRSLQQIDRSPDIETKAAEFIDHAGRYLVEIVPAEGDNPGTKVHLMAIIDKAEGCVKVAEELVENGPELLKAVDRLVAESVKHIPIRILVPANTP